MNEAGKQASAAKRPFDPQLGDLVAVRDVQGQWLRKVALSRIVAGGDFPVVWVDWEGDEVSDGGVPWPCEDVRPLAEHPDALTREQFKAETPFERFEALAKRVVRAPKLPKPSDGPYEVVRRG